MMMLPFADVIERLPVPMLRRARMARARLDAIIYRMIAERRRQRPRSRRPAVDAAGRAGRRGDGGGMTDQQVRDEAMTIFLAGHETTANALTWTLVSAQPARRTSRRSCTRRSTACSRAGCRRWRTSPSLPYIERVVTESMRLYPPAWIIGRRALDDYHDRRLRRAGAVDHHHEPVRHRSAIARYYADARALRARPLDAGVSSRRCRSSPTSRSAAAPRQCIGESFAWMELVLVVATIAQQWQLRLVPGHPVVPQPLVTLRTKHGMRMTVEKREIRGIRD